VESTALLIRDKDHFETHWTKGLEQWWPPGPQTPGLVLIHVIGERSLMASDYKPSWRRFGKAGAGPSYNQLR
jgi:general stress protein 26